MATNAEHEDLEKRSQTLPNPDPEWKDVTAVFSRAQEQLEVGEMIHLRSFSLFASMSAIELMDPKMDIGCGKYRDIADVKLPHVLKNHELIAVMDNLLACEVTWMNAHTLPQTVFSCLYHQRIVDARQPELLSFMRLQLGTMRLVQNIIQAEQIAEEEDFICWTYGFRLPPLTEAKAHCVWTDISVHMVKAGTVDKNRGSPILDRLRFRWQFFRLINAFYSPKCDRLHECSSIIIELERLLERLRETKTNSADVEELLDCVFDASVNRHLLTNTPPRTAPLLSVDQTFDYLQSILVEFKALCTLSKTILPRGPPPGSPRAMKKPQFSFQNALHALSVFSAQHVPSILSRSLMKHMLLGGTSMFNLPLASISNMLLTDMSAGEKNASEELNAQARNLAPFAEHFIWSLVRNRGRQRRHLVKSLATWDRAVELCFSKTAKAKETEGGSKANGNSSSGDSQSHANDVFCGKTPLQLVCHEVSARMMIQHWLLGFECDLYLPYEYATVFFYIGYVLSSGANATASLAGTGVKGQELHASRFALYLLDEGRLWLCRALYSFIDALTLGDLWNCDWRRPEENAETGMFGSEQLWYEQRFGFTRSTCTGPAFVDFKTFRSLMKLQLESLMENSGTEDVVIARLDDAARGFVTARRALERASKACKFYGWDPVSDEIRDLARVAVSNSVAVSQQRRIYPVWLASRKHNVSQPERVDVSAQFKTHRHFPVISVS